MKEQRPLKGMRLPHKERVYVKVNSDFDATGYIQPRSITWADGRTFMIEAVKDFRPASPPDRCCIAPMTFVRHPAIARARKACAIP